MKKLLIGISAAVMAAMASYPVSATPTFPGANGAITFTKGAEGRIWAAHPASGTTQPLLKAGAHDVTWAPDGKRVAYVRGGYIFVATMTGRTIYHVPHFGGMADAAPQWSADGKKLVFVRTAMNGRSAIYSVKLGGFMAENISGWAKRHNFRSPSWAPDGKRIVYEEYSDAAARLLIKNLSTRVVNELTPLSDVTDSSQASWSPSGKKILFRDSTTELYTIWPDGTHRAVISDGESYSGSWSPSGANIAFVESPDDDHISISEADGTVRWVFVDTSGYTRLGSPVWSPDGTQLAFAMQNAAGYDIFLLDVATGAQRLLVKGASADELSWQTVKPGSHR